MEGVSKYVLLMPLCCHAAMVVWWCGNGHNIGESNLIQSNITIKYRP